MKGRKITLATTVALIAGILITPGASAAGRPGCLVSNERTRLGTTSLQAGIDAASPGDTLVVAGSPEKVAKAFTFFRTGELKAKTVDAPPGG